MNEAGFSETIKLYNPEGAERMVTFRSESFKDWSTVEAEIATFLGKKAEAGWRLTRTNAPRAAQSLPGTPQAAPQQTAGQSGSHAFHATKLSIQFSPQGKKFGKLHGGNFNKYGVTVWPEVATQLGYDIESLAVGEYQCSLEVAYAVNDEGKPQKVIGLAGGAPQQQATAQPQASHQAAGFGNNDPFDTPF